ncbi:MAG: hypothetical protein QNK82_06985 [Akkermansiaceae bacterium]|jgi:hypothetical protein
MVQQTPLSFVDLIELSEKAVEMFDDVDFDPAELAERISLASVVRKSVPATGCAGDFDC